MTPEEIIASHCPCSEPGALIEALNVFGYTIEGRGICPGCGADADHADGEQAVPCHQCRQCPNREWHNPQ